MARVSRNNIVEEIQEVDHHKLYKVALYLRLSEEDKRSIDVYSIGNQRKICMDYLVEHKDMVLAKTFIDNGFTGANFNREGFKDLMNAIDLGEVDCVIVKDISRFGRNYIEVGKYVDIEFPERGVRFIAINDNYDSENEFCSNTQLMLRFKNIINDNYVKDYSIKIRSSIKAKMDSGKYLPSVSSMVYGYDKDVENNTYLVDEELRNIIVDIFEMRSRGEKFNNIARQLNNKGILSPGKLRYVKGYTKDRRLEDGVWIRSTIRKITGDPTYLGHRVHGKVKRDAVGEKKTRRPKEEWQIIEHTHPAIISQELFDLVQQVNQQEIAKQSTCKKQEEVGFECRPLLSDKLYCSDCGAKMLGQKNISRVNKRKEDLPNYVYYVCSEYLRKDRKHCTSHYIKGEEIVEHIVTSLQTQVQLIPDVKAFIKELNKRKKKGDTKSISKISIKKKENEEFRIRLLQDYMDNLLDKEEYLYAKGKYEKLYDDLCIEEETIISQSYEATTMLVVAEEMLESILKFKKTEQLDRKMVELLIERIEIYEKGDINIIFAFKNLFENIQSNAFSKVI